MPRNAAARPYALCLLLVIALALAVSGCASVRVTPAPAGVPAGEAQSEGIPEGKPIFTFSPPSTPGRALTAGGTNIRVNQDSSGRDQNETTIAINPTNPNNFVAGANDARLGNWTAAFYSTLDGGQTWVDGPSPARKYPSQGDPMVAFCGDGTAVFGYLDFQGSFAPHRLVVLNSTDGGRTWSAPGVIHEGSTPFADKPYIACAPSGGSYGNRVYVSWTHFTSMFGGPIRVAYSTNRGQTWQGATNISETSGVQGSCPVAGKNGLVYVFWQGPGMIEFSKSQNGGQSWSARQTAANISEIGGTSFRRNSFPTAGLDAGNGPYAGNVYAAWADNRNGDPDIYFARSTDGGATWSAPSRVNDDPVGNRRDQFFPWLAVDVKGNVHLMWHDRRADPANRKFHIYIATSRDGGVSFDRNLRVTDVASDGSLTGFLGDYAALAARAGKIVPFWSDLRPGTGEEDGYIEVEPIFYYDLIKGIRFTDRETMAFEDQEPRLGNAIVYDVLRGDVEDLRTSNPAGLTLCALEDLAAPPASLPENPAPGRAFYFLVRAQGPRGPGSYGSGTAHPDPWDGFDSTPRCN